jgi:hypothetical protein
MLYLYLVLSTQPESNEEYRISKVFSVLCLVFGVWY